MNSLPQVTPLAEHRTAGLNAYVHSMILSCKRLWKNKGKGWALLQNQQLQTKLEGYLVLRVSKSNFSKASLILPALQNKQIFYSANLGRCLLQVKGIIKQVTLIKHSLLSPFPPQLYGRYVLKVMTHQKLNKMGKPNLEIRFHSYVSHLPLSLLFPFWVSVLLRLGPLSCPKEDDSQRKQKAQARKRYRTDSGLRGKKTNPKLLMPILFCWFQLDVVDWFKLLLSLLAA